MSAAVHGYDRVLEFLIEKKVDLNATDEDGWTALHFAAMANAENSVKALLKAGAKSDLKNSDGEVAADLATKPAVAKLFGRKSSKKLAGVNEEGKKKGCVVM